MKNEREFITLKIGRNRYRKVFLDEIILFKSDNTYTEVKTNELKYTLSEPLKNFESLLGNYNLFIRVNRSYIVNLQKCVEFKNGTKPELIMENEEIIYPNTKFLLKIMKYFEVK